MWKMVNIQFKSPIYSFQLQTELNLNLAMVWTGTDLHCTVLYHVCGNYPWFYLFFQGGGVAIIRYKFSRKN